MSKIISACILKLSDETISVLKKNGINSLQELLMKRDLGLLSLDKYSNRCLEELADICERMDDFQDSLNEDFYSANFASVIDEGRSKEMPVVNDKVLQQRNKTSRDIVRPTSVRQAILDIMGKSPNTSFDIKSIRTILKRRYKGTISSRTNTIRSTLSSLVSSELIVRLEDLDHYRFKANESRKKEPGPRIERWQLDDYLSKHLNKTIEFRYKTERPNSDRRWRRTIVCGHNDKYVFTNEYYPSGRSVMYMKGRIVEVREPMA